MGRYWGWGGCLEAVIRDCVFYGWGCVVSGLVYLTSSGFSSGLLFSVGVFLASGIHYVCVLLNTIINPYYHSCGFMTDFYLTISLFYTQRGWHTSESVQLMFVKITLHHVKFLHYFLSQKLPTNKTYLLLPWSLNILYLTLICSALSLFKYTRSVPPYGKGKGKVFPLQARFPLHDRGTRRGWAVSSTSRPHFTPGKDSVPIVQEAGWAPGPVWTGGKSRPFRDFFKFEPIVLHTTYKQLNERSAIKWVVYHFLPVFRTTYCNLRPRSRTVESVAQSLYRLSYPAHGSSIWYR